jgi:uncharacterized protein (DUF433 family)
MKMNQIKREKVLEDYLEDNSFEDFLEMFDLTPSEVLQVLYTEGMIDDEILEAYLTVDQ